MIRPSVKRQLICMKTVNADELGYPMAWARNQTEELGTTQQKVENLRNEEEQQGLGEMAKNPDNSKCHPTNVAQGVTRKCSSRVPESQVRNDSNAPRHLPVMIHEPHTDTDKGEHKIRAK